MEQLYQQLILEHAKDPHGKGLRDGAVAESHQVNPTCGDEVTMRVQFAEDDELWSDEIGIRACDTDEDCDIVQRFSQEAVGADGSHFTYYVDLPLSLAPNGMYDGTATLMESCRSDADGSFVADDVYTVHHAGAIFFFEVGDDTAIVTINTRDAELTDPQSPHADQCAPFTDIRSTAGLPWDRPVDWDTPAGEPF